MPFGSDKLDMKKKKLAIFEILNFNFILKFYLSYGVLSNKKELLMTSDVLILKKPAFKGKPVSLFI